jgi:predicted nuclease with RNAse H fold
VGKAKEDLNILLDYLANGYVLTSAQGLGYVRAERLSKLGYEVVEVYPSTFTNYKKKANR